MSQFWQTGKSGDSPQYYVVTRRELAAPSMVHREGCSVLRRATHAKPWNSNPLTTDKYHHFEAHSCLSPEERITQDLPRLVPSKASKDGQRNRATDALGQATEPTNAKNGTSTGHRPRKDYKADLLQQLSFYGISPPESEYRFCGRKWRFDWAYPDSLLAIEYQGGAYYKGMGHQTTAGFTKDCLKFSTAASFGWRIILVTAGMVRDGSAAQLIEKALKASPTP